MSKDTNFYQRSEFQNFRSLILKKGKKKGREKEKDLLLPYMAKDRLQEAKGEITGRLILVCRSTKNNCDGK